MSSGENPGGQPPPTTTTTTTTTTTQENYYCYQCNRTISLSSTTTTLTCPRCNDTFLEQVDLPSPPSFPPLPLPFISSDFTPFNPVDFSSLFGNPNLTLPPRVDSTTTTTTVFDPFTFLHNYLHSMRSGGANIQLVVENSGANPGDYFFGPGLEQLIQQLAENDPNRYGTPPAAKAAVEALPNVELTEELFRSESSQCAVCMDEFEVGGKAVEMPCKHFFHKDCIVPWLDLHNSCPVCRFELPTDDPDYDHRSNGGDGGGEGEGEGSGGGGDDGVVERRFRISLPLPFLGAAAGGGGGENAGFESETRQEDLD